MAQNYGLIDIANNPRQTDHLSKGHYDITQEELGVILILVKRFGLTLVKAAKVVQMPYHKIKKYKICGQKDPKNCTSSSLDSQAVRALLQQTVSMAILNGTLTEADCEKIYQKDFDSLVIRPLLGGLTWNNAFMCE